MATIGDLCDSFIRGAPVPVKFEADIRALLRMVVAWDALVILGMGLYPSASSTFIYGWYVATGVVAFPLSLWDLRRPGRGAITPS